MTCHILQHLASIVQRIANWNASERCGKWKKSPRDSCHERQNFFARFFTSRDLHSRSSKTMNLQSRRFRKNWRSHLKSMITIYDAANTKGQIEPWCTWYFPAKCTSSKVVLWTVLAVFMQWRNHSLKLLKFGSSESVRRNHLLSGLTCAMKLGVVISVSHCVLCVSSFQELSFYWNPNLELHKIDIAKYFAQQCLEEAAKIADNIWLMNAKLFLGQIDSKKLHT